MTSPTMTSAEAAPREDLRIWEPPVLDDLGSVDLVAFNPVVGSDIFASAES